MRQLALRRSLVKILSTTCVSLLGSLAVLLLHASAPASCRASEAAGNNLVFILDASGSMGAPIQGKKKIDIAKEVMSGLLKDLPAGTNVGLVAYGHRQKSDCQDVEELAPLAPLDKESLIKKIKALNHLGMTPITDSVRKVADGLGTREGQTTIVLVSDGEETCGGDPCALVKSLKASGAKFVMHVIGFDVGDKEKAQLACIAQAGGGTYFAAKDAGEFTKAAKKVVEQTEQSSGGVKIKALRNGKPFSAYCKVLKPAKEGEDTAPAEIDDEWTTDQGTTIKLLPGVYDIVVENQADAGSAPITFKGIAVERGKTVEKVADFSGGSVFVKATRSGKPFSAFCKVLKTGKDGEEKTETEVASAWTGEAGTTFNVLPGVYDVLVEDHEDAGRPTVRYATLTVEAGKKIEKVADFSGGSLVVKASRNGKPFSAYAKVVKPTKEGEEKNDVEVAADWTGDAGATFKLQPGSYDVVVENQEDAGRATVTIKAVTVEPGKIVERSADFSGGTLVVKATRNGKPFSAFARIITAAKEGEETGESEVTAEWTGDAGATFKLLPGVYDVVVEDQEDAGRPVRKFGAVRIDPGKQVEKVAEFSGGSLSIKVWRGGKSIPAFCKVYKAVGEGEERTEGELAGDWSNEQGITFKLQPGVYDITVTPQDSEESKEFKKITVQPGKLAAFDARL